MRTMAARTPDRIAAARTGLAALVRNRAAVGVTANFGAVGVTLLMQVAGIPVFIYGFGIERYGEWLVLTAATSYLSLTDLGVAAAAATDATQLVAVGLEDRARVLLRSAWAAVTVVSVALALVVGIVVSLMLPHAYFRSLGYGQARTVLLCQLGLIVLWFHASFVEGAYRANSQLARGISYLNAIRLTEFAILILMLLAHEDPQRVAIAWVTVRGAAILLYYRTARTGVRWFALGFNQIELQQVRRLAGPSVTYMCFTLGNAITNDGFTVLVGVTLGPASTVAFTSVRTLANAVRHATTAVNSGLLPELSVALAKGEAGRARRLALGGAIVCAAGLAVGVPVLMVFGRALVHIWTGGRVQPTTVFLILMLLTVVADVPWQAATNLLVSANAHQYVGLSYVGSAIIAICAGTGLVPILSLAGIPVALFVSDVILTPLSFIQARQLFQQVHGESPSEVPRVVGQRL